MEYIPIVRPRNKEYVDGTSLVKKGMFCLRFMITCYTAKPVTLIHL